MPSAFQRKGFWVKTQTKSISLDVFAGGEQPADRPESRSAGRGAAGAAGPAQSRLAVGPDPPAGLEGGASCVGHAAPRPTKTAGLPKPARVADRADTHTGIQSEHTSICLFILYL